MPVSKPVAALAVLLAGMVPLAAQDATLTEEEYGAAMTEIRFLVLDTELHIDARYWPDLDEDLRKLRMEFERVEGFWTARDVDEAVTLAQAARQAIEPIQTAHDEQDQAAARSALRGLRQTCDACHEQFREETPDGFRIREF